MGADFGLVVVQSDFGSSLAVSWHRLAGTALGAFVGALLAAHFGRSVIVLGLGVFGIGVLSAALRLERPANRFAAIAFSIVVLVARAESAWVVALHRFLEVSAGIVAGLLLGALWPEQQTPWNWRSLPGFANATWTRRCSRRCSRLSWVVCSFFSPAG